MAVGDEFRRPDGLETHRSALAATRPDRLLGVHSGGSGYPLRPVYARGAAMLRPVLVALTACLLPLAACGPKPPKGPPEPAPAAELLAAVDIPYEQFELENGLRV